MTNEIVARLKTCRNGRRPRAVIVDHLSGAPKTRRECSRDQAGLVNFEPDVARSGKFRAIPVAISHPNSHRPNCVRPWVVPICSNLAAGGNGGDLIGNSTVEVASHAGARWVLNGVVTVPFALNGVLADRCIISEEAIVCLSGKVVAQNTAVSEGSRGRGHQSKKGLHSNERGRLKVGRNELNEGKVTEKAMVGTRCLYTNLARPAVCITGTQAWWMPYPHAYRGNL